jgi:hypothetical protein
MKLSPVMTLAAALCLTGVSLATAAGPDTDIRGKWIGKTYTIVAGRGGHWPKNAATFEQPGRFEKDLLIEITGQDGRRFWGTTTISGNGEKTQEPFIGELTGADGHDVVIADTDGYLNGHINADTLSFCYAQAAGSRTGSAVVSCSEVRRTR